MAKQNHIFKKIRKGSQAEKLVEMLVDRPAARGSVMSSVGALAAKGMGLKFECVSCGHGEILRGEAFAERFGADTPLAEVRPSCPDCSTVMGSIPVMG